MESKMMGTTYALSIANGFVECAVSDRRALPTGLGTTETALLFLQDWSSLNPMGSKTKKSLERLRMKKTSRL